MALRYNITFETGDYSQFDTDNTTGTDMIVGTPGLNGSTYKSQLSWQPTAGFGSESAVNDLSLLSSLADIFRIGCRVKTNALAFTGSLPRFNFLRTGNLSRIALIDGGSGTYDVEENLLGTFTAGVSIADDTEFTVEVRHQRESSMSAGDGELQIYVNGALQYENTAITNFTQFGDTKTGDMTHLAQSHSGFSDPGGSMYVDDIQFRDDDTPIFQPPDSGGYGLSFMPAREVEGYGWATLWLGDHMELRRLNFSTEQFDRIYNLGDATLAEIQARTKGAWVWAITDEIVFVYGNMDAPGQLVGTQHIIFLDEGVDNNFDSIVSAWSTDICASLYIGFPSGANRQYFAVRESASAAPVFYYGTNNLASNVTLPFASGTTVPHRGIAFSLPHLQAAIVALSPTSAVVAARANSPYTTWTDISGDFPTPMTGRVIAYLTGNG